MATTVDDSDGDSYRTVGDVAGELPDRALSAFAVTDLAHQVDEILEGELRVFVDVPSTTATGSVDEGGIETSRVALATETDVVVYKRHPADGWSVDRFAEFDDPVAALAGRKAFRELTVDGVSIDVDDGGDR